MFKMKMMYNDVYCTLTNICYLQVVLLCKVIYEDISAYTSDLRCVNYDEVCVGCIAL